MLHAHVDDAHEVAIARRLAARLPGIQVTRAAELVREFREYERFSTAVVNAALLPIVGGYLDRLAAGVRARDVRAPIFVMRSDGGMAAIDVAARRPASLIESGPAGGVIAAAQLGRALGLDRVLSFDMGGTTAKAGTIVDGAPEIAHEFEAAGATHSGRAQKGSGYPVRFPFVDLAEVSAGGGTIAWLDAAGTLRVGPMSAGADPGPACYGTGEQPTVTDANVVLGRLDGRALLGGSFPIDAASARRAVGTVARVVDGDVERAAAGVVALVDAEMAKVLRIVSVERGHDPRDFTLVAFGGGGPLHACAVARDVGVRTIVVPALPGVFSAYGLLAADVRIAVTRSLVVAADEAGWSEVRRVVDELCDAAAAALAEQRIRPEARTYASQYDLRYAGQGFELTVHGADSAAAAAARFHERHRERYGYCTPQEAVQIVTVRVVGVGRLDKPPARSEVDAALLANTGDEARAPQARALRERRPVWIDDGFETTPIFTRELLVPGDTVAGPAIIEQYDTTTLVAREWSACVAADGELVMTAVGA